MTTHVEDGALVRYLDHECDRDELAVVQEHLDRCDMCGSRVAELRRHSGAVSIALRAMDAPVRMPRRPARWGLRVAVAAVVVLGVAGAVEPVRAWIIGTTQALWETVMGRSVEPPTPTPPMAAARSASVTFVPEGTQFVIEVATRQAAGRLVLTAVPGDSATTVILGGSGAEDLVVLPAGLRIVNPATSTASYEVRLPRHLTRIVVHIGSAAPVTFDPQIGSLEVDLGRE
jgi:hypothetical protein